MLARRRLIKMPQNKINEGEKKKRTNESPGLECCRGAGNTGGVQVRLGVRVLRRRSRGYVGRGEVGTAEGIAGWKTRSALGTRK